MAVSTMAPCPSWGGIIHKAIAITYVFIVSSRLARHQQSGRILVPVPFAAWHGIARVAMDRLIQKRSSVDPQLAKRVAGTDHVR
jgi:hypothetical protein